YRAHLAVSTDRFVIAEGIRGQVMMVFGLPSYQIVFKVMKDRFPATKSVSHEDVRRAYQLVKTHDRVGRMADTQEFHFFEFPRQRFEPALLEELLAVAGDSIELHEDTVVIRHLYAERMMTPLNLYIQQCSEFQLQQVIWDYGAAVRELAAANIFPGDMLLKNFGVTRHSRVVFYDYDEICYLTDVNFRDMPADARGPGGEAWFDVGEYDVFPEEFATFLFPDQTMREIFEEQHADLFTAAGWRQIQAQVRDRILLDVYPYPDRARLLADSV
ncbi:MAG: bifunctional isocitrate dehydrogenase kinase/phosphatase, partial [Proteobacteria bacterium]|nr:bifunctional isocitrate dehydrogenase kinase/phosphatase [Pseudomonadota bacterium]